MMYDWGNSFISISLPIVAAFADIIVFFNGLKNKICYLCKINKYNNENRR